MMIFYVLNSQTVILFKKNCSHLLVVSGTEFPNRHRIYVVQNVTVALQRATTAMHPVSLPITIHDVCGITAELLKF